MEGSSGGGVTISAEYLQNIQSAVDSSGIIGQVQVIETDEGPMTVIFMEEGADASALNNSPDAGLTIGDGAQYHCTMENTGDLSQTQIQYVDDEGNLVDPLQYCLESGSGTQVQYQFIESAEDYTGSLGNVVAGAVGRETNLTSQDGNAVDPVINLGHCVTKQSIADESGAQHHVPGQQSKPQQVPGQQSEQVLNQEDAYQQIQGQQMANQQATGQPVSGHETLLQATGEDGETLYITESGEIIKIDTSLLVGSQFSMNDGCMFYESSIGNSSADEHFVATKLLTDPTGTEDVSDIAQPHTSSAPSHTVAGVSNPKIVTKPGVTTDKKQSYTHKVVSNSQPAVGKSLLPSKTATSFNLKSMTNAQSTSNKQSFSLPRAAKQKPQVLTFKSNEKTYIITSYDSETAAAAASMGVEMLTKPNNSSAMIVKSQLTSQIPAVKKLSKPIVTSQTKPDVVELDKGTMTSISPISKVQTMTTIMKSQGTSTSSLVDTDRIEYNVPKSSVTQASVQKSIKTISKQAFSTSATGVKNIVTMKPTTLLPQVSKLLIAGVKTNTTNVKQYGIPYKMSQHASQCSDGVPDVNKLDTQSETGVAKPGSTEVKKLTENVAEGNNQTVTGEGNINPDAGVNGDKGISVSNNPSNSAIIINKHVDDNIVTATDVALPSAAASSAVCPIDEQGLENSENINTNAGLEDASNLQTEAAKSSKSVVDSSEVNTNVPYKVVTSSHVINTTEYEDYIPNGLENYKPIFRLYQCGICSETFKMETNFKEHHLHKHTEGLTCLACNQNFRSGHILNNHMILIHTVGKPLTCPFCNLGFLKSSLYWAHAVRHAYVFKCSKCQKVFNSNVDLQRHLVDVHIEHNLKCVQCGQVFRSREEVNEHKKVKHNMEEQNSQVDLAEQSTEGTRKKSLEDIHLPADSESDQSSVALYIDSHGHLTQQQQFRPAKSVGKKPLNLRATEQKKEIEQNRTLEKSSSETNKLEITNSSHSDQKQSSTVNDKQLSVVSTNKQLLATSPQIKSIEVPDSDVTIQLYADGTLVTSDKSGTNYSKMRLEDLGLDHTMLEGNTNIELLIVQGDGKEVRAVLNTSMQGDIHETDSANKNPELCKESQGENKLHVQPMFEDEDGNVRATMGDPRPYKCSMCPRTFKFYRTFKCHEVVHSKTETYTCPLCKRLFAREINLKSHLQLHEKKMAMQRLTSTNGSSQGQTRDGKLWHCEHCGMSFTACTNMLRHIRHQHDTITGVACPVCHKRFLNETNVQRHAKIHVGPFPCSYCDSKFEVHDELVNHLKEQHIEKLFSCRFCDRVLLSKNLLISHVSEQHGSTSEGQELLEDLKKYECEECGMKFTKVIALTKHAIAHTKEGVFQCIVCPKRFNCQWKLSKHQKTHEATKLHECPKCFEKFKFSHVLDQHKVLYHQGPYLCSECKEEFSSHLNLEDHQYEKHEGGFTCTKCSKRLKNSLELDKHSNTEHVTVDTSLLCENCGESFEYKPQLKMHLLKKHFNYSKADMFKEYPEMRTVHDELTCEICDTYCKNKTVYKQHFKDEHFDGDSDAMYEVCPELKKFPDPPDPVDCDHCGKTCSNLTYLNMHLKVHGSALNSKEKKDRDDSGSSNEEDDEEREVDFTNIEPRETDKSYKCKECGEKFARQAALTKHAKSHEKDYLKEAIKNMVQDDLLRREKLIKNEDFDSSALEESPKRMSSEMHIVCSTCHQVFKSKAELSAHRKADDCGKVDDKVIGEEMLSDDKILLVFDAKTLKCKCCAKTYCSTYNLKRHLEQIHSINVNGVNFSTQDGEQGFGEMKFSKRSKFSALEKAGRAENKKKTFRAPSKSLDDGSLCKDGTDISTFLGINFNLGKAPASQCNITAVKKKGHKCTVCGKGFSREATLKKHLLLHKEVNDSKFDLKPDKRHNFKANWKKTLYPCENCGNKYSTAGGLIYHSRLRHPDINEDSVVTKINEITDKLKDDKVGKIKVETMDHEIKMAQKRKLSDSSERINDQDKKKTKIDKTDKSSFPCQHCDVVYKSSNGLSLHLNAFHTDKCGPCYEGNATVVQQSLSGRVITKNSRYEEHIRCCQCSKLFNDIPNYRRHIQAVHKNKQKVMAQKSEPEDYLQRCEHCDKKFLELSDLRRHLKMKHNLCFDDSKPYLQTETKDTAGSSAVYDCDVCEQKFSSLFNLQNHMLAVHDENDDFDIEVMEEAFQCSACHTEFESKKTFGIHMRKHTGEKPYGCSVCDKKCISKHRLELHLRKFHRKQWLQKIKCKICLFLFDTKDAMLKHKMVHREEVFKDNATVSTPSIYKCLKCDKLFRWKRNLVSHARIFHRDSDPLTCGICNKVFPDKESIKDHLTEHHEQKRTCEICMKSFSKNTQLKEHKSVAHKGAVNLSCDICRQSFVTKQKLLEHMLSHTSIMPHKCDICSMSFRAIHLLKAHKLRHILKEKHQELNLESLKSDSNKGEIKPKAVYKKCKRNFSTESSLKVHVAKAHKKGNNSKSSLKAKPKITAAETKDVSPKTEFKEKTFAKVETKQKATKCETLEKNTIKTEQESKSVLKKTSPLSKMKISDLKQKAMQHSLVIKPKVPAKYKMPLTKPNTPLIKLKSPVLKIKSALQKKALNEVQTAKRHIPATKQKTTVQEIVKSIRHCGTCSLDFASHKLFKKHMKHAHTTIQGLLKCKKVAVDLMCPICQSVFSRRQNLKRHLEIVHNVQLSKPPNANTKKVVKCFHCSKCNRVFWYKDQFELHLRKAHSEDKAALKLDLEFPGVIKKEVDDANSMTLKQGQPGIEKMRQKCEFCSRIHWSKKTFEDHLLNFHPEHAESYGLKEEQSEVMSETDSDETNKYLSVHLFENTRVEKLSAYPVVMIERMPCGFGIIPVVDQDVKLKNGENRNAYKSISNDTEMAVEMTVKCVLGGYEFEGNGTVTGYGTEEQSSDQNQMIENAAEKLVIENVRHIENVDKISESGTDKFTVSFKNEVDKNDDLDDKIDFLNTVRKHLESYKTSDCVRTLGTKMIQNISEKEDKNEVQHDIRDTSIAVKVAIIACIPEKDTFEFENDTDSQADENSSQFGIDLDKDKDADSKYLHNKCEKIGSIDDMEVIASGVHEVEFREINSGRQRKESLVINNKRKVDLNERNTELHEHVLDDSSEENYTKMIIDDNRYYIESLTIEQTTVTESNSKLFIAE